VSVKWDDHRNELTRPRDTEVKSAREWKMRELSSGVFGAQRMTKPSTMRPRDELQSQSGGYFLGHDSRSRNPTESKSFTGFSRKKTEPKEQREVVKPRKTERSESLAATDCSWLDAKCEVSSFNKKSTRHRMEGASARERKDHELHNNKVFGAAQPRRKGKNRTISINKRGPVFTPHR